MMLPYQLPITINMNCYGSCPRDTIGADLPGAVRTGAGPCHAKLSDVSGVVQWDACGEGDRGTEAQSQPGPGHRKRSNGYEKVTFSRFSL